MAETRVGASPSNRSHEELAADCPPCWAVSGSARAPPGAVRAAEWSALGAREEYGQPKTLPREKGTGQEALWREKQILRR